MRFSIKVVPWGIFSWVCLTVWHAKIFLQYIVENAFENKLLNLRKLALEESLIVTVICNIFSQSWEEWQCLLFTRLFNNRTNKMIHLLICSGFSRNWICRGTYGVSAIKMNNFYIQGEMSVEKMKIYIDMLCKTSMV